MKRLIITVVILMGALTGGSFASTWLSTAASVNTAAASSDFGTVTAADISSLTPTVYGDYTGSWTTGTLFTVTPDATYSGDMEITIHLVNTGQLNKYFHHLNMALQYLDNSDTPADDQGGTQLMTLDNSEASFIWTNGTGTGPYRIELVGGGFRLHPLKAVAGGSVQPEFWVELKQR